MKRGREPIKAWSDVVKSYAKWDKFSGRGEVSALSEREVVGR